MIYIFLSNWRKRTLKVKVRCFISLWELIWVHPEMFLVLRNLNEEANSLTFMFNPYNIEHWILMQFCSSFNDIRYIFSFLFLQEKREPLSVITRHSTNQYYTLQRNLNSQDKEIVIPKIAFIFHQQKYILVNMLCFWYPSNSFYTTGNCYTIKTKTVAFILQLELMPHSFILSYHPSYSVFENPHSIQKILAKISMFQYVWRSQQQLNEYIWKIWCLIISILLSLLSKSISESSSLF